MFRLNIYAGLRVDARRTEDRFYYKAGLQTQIGKRAHLVLPRSIRVWFHENASA